MPVEDPTDIQVGETIRFKTLSPHDNVLWTGKVNSLCDYEIAKTFQDVDTYYWDVKKVVPELAAKEALHYLIIKVLENELNSTTRVFAREWIDPSSLERIMANTYKDIRVYDIDSSKAQDLIVMLRAHGYTCQVIST